MSTMNTPVMTHRSVRCPTCGHAVPVAGRGVTFCPHCGRRLRRGGGVGTAVAVAALMVTLGGVWLSAGRRAHSTTVVTARAVAPADPVDAMLNDAQVARVTWAVDLDRRADDVRAARQALVDQVADLSNLSARVTAAVNRAADEDRWPAKVAGRSLLRADADALLGRLADAAAADRRAADRDATTVDALVAAAASARAESGRASLLRHDLASHPTPDRRADIERRAAELRDGSAIPPAALTLSADPARPADLDALLR